MNRCRTLKTNPANYKHKDLPYGKDLFGENLKKALEGFFSIYSNENVVRKIAQNASSQRNESLNSTIGSKHPKIRFYGGSESADQRVACAVAQKNIGKQYLKKVLENADITPGSIMDMQIEKMDDERKQDKVRKQTTAFKRRRRQLAKIRSSKDGRLESREGTVYESGSALSLEPEVLNACNISKAELCHIENRVPPFCSRPKKIFEKLNANFTYNFVIFDTETNCGGKKAELVELAAICHNTGESFTKFVLPKFDINEHASRVNKFHIIAFGNERILYRNGNQLETGPPTECLRSFADFLKTSAVKTGNATLLKSVKTVLIGHNATVFDTPLLIRSINQSGDHIKSMFQDLDLHFADSQTLLRHLVKNNNEQLRHVDGSVPKENLRDIYRCLFQSDFENSHEGFADVVTLRKILFQSKLALTTENMINNSQVINFSNALVDTQYLDKSHDRLLTFKNRLFDDSDRSIIKKTLAKKLADGGLTLDALRNLHASLGPRGVAALLANPPSSYQRKSPRGTKCSITLQKIINFLKSEAESQVN